MPFNIHSLTERQENMNSLTPEDINILEYKKKFLPETIETKKTKEVLSLFSKALSSMKIYPSENPSVKSFFESFHEKMEAFLYEYEELKLTVEEFSFSFNGEKVFQEENKKTSLPFLFFKDGMRKLSFYKGLEKKELQDFLEIVKEDSDLPQEESDIVNSIWTKDFAFIRYFAHDEFLESNIGGEVKEIDYNINNEEFSKGKIELTEEDKEDIQERNAALGFQANASKEENKGKDINLEDVNLPFQLSTKRKDEDPELESLLEESRSTPPLTEMINLLFEILYLEERIDQFSATLNVLNQFYKEIIYNSNFTLASLILNRLQELKELFTGQSEEKMELLEKTIQNVRGESSIVYLKKLFLNNQIIDFDSFFQYLRLLGPNAIPLVGDIWEEAKEPIIRLKASNFLYKIGKKDISLLINIAKEHRVSLSKEVIVLLGRIGDKKAVSYLNEFICHKNKEIRLAVIYTLAKIGNGNNNRILIESLSDEDEEVRTRAAIALKYRGDETTFNLVLDLAKKKEFKEKSRLEKKVLLEFLATTKPEEAIALLESILKKKSFFSRSKQNETRLCTIPVLEAIASPEAQKTLEKGAQIRNKTISHASKFALKKIVRNLEFNKTLTGKQQIA